MRGVRGVEGVPAERCYWLLLRLQISIQVIQGLTPPTVLKQPAMPDI